MNLPRANVAERCHVAKHGYAGVWHVYACVCDVCVTCVWHTCVCVWHVCDIYIYIYMDSAIEATWLPWRNMGQPRNLGKIPFPPGHLIKRGNPVSLSLSLHRLRLSLSLFHRPARPTPPYRATGSRRGQRLSRLPLPQPAHLAVSLFHSSRLGEILCGLCEGREIRLGEILSRKCRKGEEKWISCEYFLMHEMQESLNLVFQCTNLFCISWSLDYFQILSFLCLRQLLFFYWPLLASWTRTLNYWLCCLALPPFLFSASRVPPPLLFRYWARSVAQRERERCGLKQSGSRDQETRTMVHFDRPTREDLPSLQGITLKLLQNQACPFTYIARKETTHVRKISSADGKISSADKKISSADRKISSADLLLFCIEGKFKEARVIFEDIVLRDCARVIFTLFLFLLFWTDLYSFKKNDKLALSWVQKLLAVFFF